MYSSGHGNTPKCSNSVEPAQSPLWVWLNLLEDRDAGGPHAASAARLAALSVTFRPFLPAQWPTGPALFVAKPGARAVGQVRRGIQHHRPFCALRLGDACKGERAGANPCCRFGILHTICGNRPEAPLAGLARAPFNTIKVRADVQRYFDYESRGCGFESRQAPNVFGRGGCSSMAEHVTRL